ncbi:retrovirus-related pol polyprotein from transposon TNT 1-94 [Tanacetum coccineum]
MARQCPKPKRKRDATWFREKILLVEAQGNGNVLNEEELEFLVDLGIAEAKAVLMANLSSYGPDVLSEVPISDNTNNDMLNQSVQEMPYSEPSHFVEHPENEIHSDINIISYSQYLIESQNATVNNGNLITNESLSTELERYKEWVKMLEERQNVDLHTREKLIFDDIIWEKNAQFANFEKEINNLKQTLSEQSKEKELLTKTFNVFKNEFKEKEAKNIDTEIALEKKVKKLDNIVCKMGQSAQTVHILTKPQVFYDNNLNQALGFQNPFYLKKAQQIRPMLYEGNVIAKETNVISIADSEKTLMLEEESRSKMLLKQSDSMVLEKKVNTKSIDYAELNQLSKDFGKRFVPQRELSDEQALHPIIDQSTSSPITPNALTEGEWGFEHTKVVFQNEIIPFLKTLKDIFNVFDKDLLNEKQFLIENDRLLDQIISQDIVNIVVHSSVDPNTSVNVNSSVAMIESVNYVEMYNKCLELEAELIKQHHMVEKDEYNRLSKRFSELEQNCISLEIAMQINKEFFQKNNTSVYQTEPSFDQLFELNNSKAKLQAKDTTIKKLKAHIKRVNETSTSESLKKDFDAIETINLELEHRVTKLIAENEHLKQTYKQLYDSIKPSHVRAKEQADSLVNQLNQKSVEITDLNAQLQEKVFVITTLKNNLRKFKGKDIVDNAAQVSNATTIAPGMYKLDLVILAPTVKNNREAHKYYLKHTMEQAAILREVVEQAKSRNPLDSASYSACMYVKLIQELLGYVRDTCPDIPKPSKKLVMVTPINKKKTVQFADPVASSSNIPKVTNRPLLSSTGVKPSTSASGSKPSGNTKNDKISRAPSSNEKNKVDVQSRKVKSHAKALCSVCNECLFDANHAISLIDHVNSMNVRAKSVSKKIKRRKEWKPTGKVITSTKKVPLREPIPLKVVAQELVVTKVYTRRPKVPKTIGSNNKPKIVKSLNANKTEPGTSRGSNTSFDPSSSSLIEWRLSKLFCGNAIISRVYYVEGLGHNLFLVGQFCDSDLEVAFRKHTCFIHNLEGVDLLKGSRGTNLYSLSIGDMMASSPICLLSKATKTKSWLWHRRLSHLNFGAINHLARHGLVRGLPRL